MAIPRLSGIARALASIMAGSAAGQGLVILCYPVISRLYSPAEFGLLTVFTSIAGLVSNVSTLSLESAVPLPREEEEAAAVAWSGLIAVAVTSVLTGVVGVFVGGALGRLLGVPGLGGVWWLLCLSVFVLGAYLVLSEWMIRARSYTALGWRNALQGVGQVVTQIGLGLAGVRPLGLLLGLGVGRLSGMGGLLSRGGLLRQPRPTLEELRAAVRRYRRFPLLASPSTLLNSAGLEMPLLLISAFYGDARAGLLGLTVRVVGGPAGYVGQAVLQVFTGESSVHLREPAAAMGAMVRQTALRLFLVGIGPVLVLVLFAPQLFAFVFGAEWAEAGEYARFLALAYLGQFTVVPLSSTLFLLERQAQELAWVTVRLALTVTGPLVCGLVGAPILVAIITYAAGQVLGYSALLVLSLRAADASDAATTAASGS